MKNGLRQLFIDELGDMCNAENQIKEAFPKLINLASSPDLKEALCHHLKETEKHASQIEAICNFLHCTVSEKKCEGMRGLLSECERKIKGKAQSPLLDAVIINACQKIEHYEIASYGTLRAFAEQLDLDSEVVDFIQEILDEEGATDRRLTKIAEGTALSKGVNEEAFEEIQSMRRR
jgi:ferritin-like metal-binding protein YciE